MKLFACTLILVTIPALSTRVLKGASHRKEDKKHMQQVLMDTFIVPEKSLTTFLEKVQESASYVKTLPGYVEGYVYLKQAGNGRVNVVTTVVWENHDALTKAQQLAQAEFQKRHFNPKEIIHALGIESERGIYPRTPYGDTIATASSHSQGLQDRDSQ